MKSKKIDQFSSKKIDIKFKKLYNNATIPTKSHPEDIGMDVVAIRVRYNEEMDCYIYDTGIAWEADNNVVLLGFPRSSNCKTDCYLTNSVGIIDPNYRGEIQFRYKNRVSFDQRVLTLYNEMWNLLGFWKRMRAYFSKSYKFKMMQDLDKQAHDIILNQIMDYAPYNVGERIGQFVAISVPDITVTEAQELNDSDRGVGGFGSTGK